jgi:creatinine amidohydrolase
MIARPDLVHMDRAATESGADLNRLDLPAGVYTGIWWYARFPNHCAGNGADVSRALGESDMKAWVASIANTIRGVKSDRAGPRLQKEFFDGSRQPATKR